MKKDKMADLRTKSESELKNLIKTQVKEIKNISIEMKGRRLRDVSLLKKKKKDLAIMLTILKEKELIK